MISIIELFKGFNYPVGDAILNAVLGLVITFVILILLVAVFVVLGNIIKYLSIDRTGSFENNNNGSITNDALNIETVNDEEEHSEELIAVISAAIMAQIESENSEKPAKPRAPFIIRKK